MTEFEWNLMTFGHNNPQLKTFFIATQHAQIQRNQSFTKLLFWLRVAQCHLVCLSLFLSFFPLFLLFSPLPHTPLFSLLNVICEPLNWFKGPQKDHHPHWKRNHSVGRPKIHSPLSHPSPISSLIYLWLGHEHEFKSLALWLTNWVALCKSHSTFQVSAPQQWR